MKLLHIAFGIFNIIIFPYRYWKFKKRYTQVLTYVGKYYCDAGFVILGSKKTLFNQSVIKIVDVEKKKMNIFFIFARPDGTCRKLDDVIFRFSEEITEKEFKLSKL